MSKPKIYDVIATGTTEPRDIRDRFADVINVKDFGAAGDGITNDTEAIQAALNSGSPLIFDSTVYNIDGQLIVPTGSRIYGTMRLKITNVVVDQLVADGNYYICKDSLYIEDNVYIENVEIETTPFVLEISGVEKPAYQNMVRLGSNSIIRDVLLWSNTALRSDGIHISGSNSAVGHIEARKIDRPIFVGGDNGCSHVVVGGYTICGYIRGIKVQAASHVFIGSGSMEGRSETYEGETPGYNSILFEDSSNVFIDNCRLADAGEHCVRFGGTFNSDVKFCDIQIVRASASAIKINSSAGITTDNLRPNKNISFGNITIVDNGYHTGSQAKADDTLRFSHAENVSIASVSVLSSGLDVACHNVLILNNIKNLSIGGCTVQSHSGGIFAIKYNNDLTAEQITTFGSFLGSKDIYIRNIAFDDSASIGSYNITVDRGAAPVTNVNINIQTGVLTKSLYLDAGTGAVSDINITGKVRSGTWYAVSGNALSSVNIDLMVSGQKMCGTAAYLHNGSGNVFSSRATFANDGAATGPALCVVSSGPNESAVGALGGAMVFSRPTSAGRRGGCIASIQTGASGFNTGLVFYSGTVSVSSAVFLNSIVLDHTGNILPGANGTQNIGSGSSRFNNIYAANGTIQTSDEREKTQISDLTDAVLDAWGDVRFAVFAFTGAVALKGADARMHTGVIAQQVVDAFAKHGLDASRYGLLCHDAWEEYTETVTVIDQEAVMDGGGNEVSPEVTHTEKRLIPSGDRYGIRYEEALCLEAAYQRRRADRIEARVAALEATLLGKRE